MTTRRVVGLWICSACVFFAMAATMAGDLARDHTRKGVKTVNSFDWSSVLTATGVAALVSGAMAIGLILAIGGEEAT